MSEWRDIWKESLTANRQMVINKEDGFYSFSCLLRKYGEDGMIHYAIAEAYESLRDYPNALSEYKKAKELFSVQHWKNVAENSIKRVAEHKSAEEYYDLDNFDELIWYAFQKTYEFINLDDFVRYVCLSAVSRATSEWPLSLVDFRTVLELQIKNNFPEIIEEVEKREGDYSLAKVIKELQFQKYISFEIADSMHKIRKSGNIAAHDLKMLDSENVDNISNFIKVLEYFNKI